MCSLDNVAALPDLQVWIAGLREELSSFTSEVDRDRKDHSLRAWKQGMHVISRARKWSRPDLLPLAPMLACATAVSVDVSGYVTTLAISSMSESKRLSVKLTTDVLGSNTCVMLLAWPASNITHALSSNTTLFSQRELDF